MRAVCSVVAKSWDSPRGETTMGRDEAEPGRVADRQGRRGERRRYGASGGPLLRGHVWPGAPVRAGPVRDPQRGALVLDRGAAGPGLPPPDPLPPEPGLVPPHAAR